MNQRRTWSAGLVLGAIITLGGCSQHALTPSASEVEAFIQRRPFALAQVNKLRPAMEGTTYSDTLGRPTSKPVVHDFSSSDDHVRRNMKYDGVWYAHYWTEFELILSEDLVKSQRIGKIAERISRYYASDLVQAGWHPAAGGTGTFGETRYWENQFWTDLGQGVKLPPDKGVSDYQCSYTHDDLRRGYFKVRIGVNVDNDCRRAHISLVLFEHLGM